MLRSRILTGLVIAAFAGIFGSQVASCTLDQEGGTEVETGKACTSDANCDDNNPCTTDTCPTDTLVCQYAKQASGAAPDSAQTPNDCKSVVCTMGASSIQDDPLDVVNDNNSCTTDACTNGSPTNTPMADGSACNVGNKTGSCTKGACEIKCANNNDCADGNPCSNDLCNTSAGICTFDYLDGVLTPGFTQIPGDCKVQFCEAGMDTQLNDDADLPDDGNSCTTDVCTAGVPSNPAVGPSIPCMLGDVNVCNGSGACVECVVPADCVTITETECEKRDCVNNKCQIAYEGQTTLASPVLQTAKDCKKVVCDGVNGTTTVNDDTDLPDDQKPCTTDTCSNGTPTFMNKAQGTTCGNNQVCNATGGCVGCNAPTDCMGTDDFCKTRTCISNVCGVSFTANGTDLPTGQTAGDCKVLECDGMGNVKSSVLTSDVPVDMNDCTLNQCSMAGQPSNPNSPLNASCSSNGGDVCNGSGVCKKSNSKPCAAAGECLSALCVDGYCCNSACTTDCQSCNVAGKLGICSDVPSGTQDGMCVAPMWTCNSGADCDLLLGQGCGMSNGACLSNFCADGVCCNEACGATCKACNLAATNGTCSNIPAGMPDNNPTNACAGTNQCDGTGTCKKTIGSACTGNAECLSGFCVDNICCMTSSCSPDCKACNVAGSLGTCANVAMGNDHGGCMGTSMSCDGAGACKTENGQPCPGGGATNCFSGVCADGVCCNMACSGTCKSCTVAASPGTCSNIPMGTDPDSECADELATCGNSGNCDGSGACQKYAAGTTCVVASCTAGVQQNADTCNATNMCIDGGTTMCTPYICGATTCKTSCASDTDCVNGYYCSTGSMCLQRKANGMTCGGNNNECTNGNCVDGYCCNTMCTNTCQGCAVAGSLGTCSNLELFTDDTNAPTTCTGVNTCNGTGQCKLKNGQACTMNNQCASNSCPNGVNMCQ